jgi:hypothetical protein
LLWDKNTIVGFEYSLSNHLNTQGIALNILAQSKSDDKAAQFQGYFFEEPFMAAYRFGKLDLPWSNE